MRVFVTGATGALGRHLVPGLIAAGHQVTATTRTPGKVAQLRAAGAEPVVLDGLDRGAVIAAVQAAGPEVIVHQMTALADMRSLRNVDRVFAATNELRTRGTDNLLAAAARAGTRRVVAQSNAGMYERSGGPHRLDHRLAVQPVDDHRLRARLAQLRDLAGRPRGGGDLVTRRDQRRDEVASECPGRSRDEDSHDGSFRVVPLRDKAPPAFVTFSGGNLYPGTGLSSDDDDK